MRVLIDANVVADAFVDPGDRPQGDRTSAQLILEAVARRHITGIITPVIFAFVGHVVKPRRKEHRLQMEAALDFLLDITEWAAVTPANCRTALASTFKDVEDGMEFFACERLDAIVTRDVRDYRDHVNVPVYTATQFVQKHLK